MWPGRSATDPPGDLPADLDEAAGRAVAAYLGLALGDALGATVEFLTPNEIRHQHGVHRDITGGGWLRLKAGQITDDTGMALALGDAILACGGGVEATAVAQAFDQWMRSKPVDIGNTVRRNLIRFRQTGQAQAQPSDHDAGNGAAMRLLPAALATLHRSEAEAIAATLTQARVTHYNPLSDAACAALTLMLRDAFAGMPLQASLNARVRPLIERFPAFEYRLKRRDNPSGFVVETMQAVCQALEQHTDFEGSLINVVNRGGDADTTGAIAGMLAGAFYGPDALPARWRKALEATARQRCITQALALLNTGGHRTDAPTGANTPENRLAPAST